ncbi:hypothetical protein [Saccharicrinis aurantiacus]|uniref:hypothetical protein n=1 Tax=Saccharicrinis aurantiacus TaxID=1849719 RepID=UPI0024919455|nr:hypothetical protein [Saccharicrinis aurantiacus]
MKLAETAGMSRTGLYNALDNPEVMKFGSVVKLCSFLNIDLTDFTSSSIKADSFSSFIDYSEVLLIVDYFKSYQLSIRDICLFLNVTEEELSRLINYQSISTQQIIGLCSFYKLPYEVFFKNQFRSKFKDIKLQEFIDFREIVLKSQSIKDYNTEILPAKIQILKILNRINDQAYKLDSSLTEYMELFNEFGSVINFPVHIINDSVNSPLVFISNYPNHNVPLQTKIEDVTKKVYTNMLGDDQSMLDKIVWVEITYFSENSLNVSFVKFNNQEEFINPKWLTVRGANDNKITVDEIELKSFINLK